MYNRPVIFALLSILVASIEPAVASPINVTNSSLVTLQTNDSLLFSIASDCSPAQMQILLGGVPLSEPLASIPGTSGVYVPGILFSGTLESQDGSLSIPLTDPDATRLGLPAGDMLLTPGSRSGGSYSGPIDLLSAAVTLTPQEAATLFTSGEAVIDLQNIGAAITFGYSGVPIGNDFSASLISPGGAQSVGARVTQVDCAHPNADAPEPGTLGLLIIGLTMVAARFHQFLRAPRRFLAVWGRLPAGVPSGPGPSGAPLASETRPLRAFNPPFVCGLPPCGAPSKLRYVADSWLPWLPPGR